MPSHPTAGITIGVDIGGTNIRAARVAPDGRLSGLLRVRTDSQADAVELVGDLCERLSGDDVGAIGIGIPGRLSRDGREVLSSGYVDLAGRRLADVVGVRTGRPVVLENDAHMALLAELQLGAATNTPNVVMFTVGTGIGGAVAMDRRVLRGRGNAGQLGHLSLDPDGPVCNCGRRGCSEVLASGTALKRLMDDAGLAPGTTVEALLERGPDDPAAAGVLCRWAAAWRGAIDSTVAVLDPDLVVLGGGLGNAAVAALAACSASTSAWFECPVIPAALGDDAGVIGAGLRAFAG